VSSSRAPLCPARLEPIFSPRPWGARSLAPLFPEKSNLAEPLGEAWLTGNECRFASGPFAGKKLGEIWPEMPVEWTGTQSNSSDAAFPLLVKFIFAQEKLSVQVHPDDAYASAHEKAAGGRGKTEMWYVIDAAPGAEVLVGLKANVTAESFKHAIGDASVEDSLQHVPLHPGDAMFVPAGTAHTIGAGFVLCEIQQSSDLTYRVYDYNRRDAHGNSRELHLEKAFDVMRFGEQRGGKVVPATIRRDGITKTFFTACHYFATERWQFDALVSTESSTEGFELLIIIEGAGSIRWSNESAKFAPAQIWLIPAGLGLFELTPESSATILRTYVPANLSSVVANLQQQGVSAEDASRLVFA
jgi:mannose-6-phosphate isomerase